MKKKHLIITGGHVTPALAFIDEIGNQQNLKIIFVGRRTAMEGDKAVSYEYQEITKRGLTFIPLTTGRLQRQLTPYTLISLFKIPIGIWQGFKIISHYKPCGVVSFGGYLALPVVIAARIWGVPIITHEQTTIPGLSNRLISFLAKKICISWPETASYFPKDRTVLTGNPLRRSFLTNTMKKVINKFDKPILYICGGSLGSHIINRTVAEILKELLADFTIIHQCGNSEITGDYAFLKRIKGQLPKSFAKRYLLKSYLSEQEVVWTLHNASLIVARAGANTITELAFMGKPALLIPLPHAGMSEQEANAKRLVQIGLAYSLPQRELNSKSLFKTIFNMVKNKSYYEKKTKKARILVYPDAAKRLAKIVREEFSLLDS